jgi:hypothetical protein
MQRVRTLEANAAVSPSILGFGLDRHNDTRQFPGIDLRGAERALTKLQRAISSRSSARHCLRAWSWFIRTRDGEQCVVCGRSNKLTAHHILRKSFMEEGQFLTGNGITLCQRCHREPHLVFNRRPNLNLPMDAEGGENIELLFSFYCTLADDATNRGLLHREDFYYFTDQLLAKFRLFQSIDWDVQFPGSRLEQAALIWRQTPRCTLNAILTANGFPPAPPDFIQIGPVAILHEP